MKVFHTSSLSERDFDWILTVLGQGGVIAYPTDTAYGLGADPFNAEAVSRIFQIKGRPETKPVLLLVNSISMAERIARPTRLFYAIAERFWPGSLTLVVPARAVLPDVVTAGSGTVGLRWGDAPFANRLLEARHQPLTATSANRSGMPSPVTASEVKEQLGESLSALIDGGLLPARTGSTLLDITSDTPVLLRHGPVRFEDLQEFLAGTIRVETT
jgi:L-threonylcarbamoyladenylate synthase